MLGLGQSLATGKERFLIPDIHVTLVFDDCNQFSVHKGTNDQIHNNHTCFVTCVVKYGQKLLFNICKYTLAELKAILKILKI